MLSSRSLGFGLHSPNLRRHPHDAFLDFLEDALERRRSRKEFSMQIPWPCTAVEKKKKKKKTSHAENLFGGARSKPRMEMGKLMLRVLMAA